MIHDIPKPKISDKFTIEDIHIIREWTYERLKDATSEEKCDYYNKSVPDFLKARMLPAKKT
ncbi:MAG: hypothetical protein LBM41_02920 [Ruminococcus sp.]|jgi:hypothetical protein|nr:hypothetical protein [Ruminococcus sp.]